MYEEASGFRLGPRGNYKCIISTPNACDVWDDIPRQARGIDDLVPTSGVRTGTPPKSPR
jgi:hypothetical protein